MRRIGVVVNPIAGMGGRVGLKGTDGKVEEARARGAEPRAPDRAKLALDALARHDDVTLLVAGDPMGATVAREAGFEPRVVYSPDGDDDDDTPGTTADDDTPGTTADDDTPGTTAGDTRAAVCAFCEDGVDLVLFVGGDGTAVDVAETLESVADPPPMLGVPAGVKVYSSVFAVDPAAAGHVAATFERTEAAEVNDIDEDAYREGEVTTELRAVTRVPVAEERQASKQLAGGSVASLARTVAAEFEDDVTYVLGPGSTVGEIKSALGFQGSPLGVDVWRDGEVIVEDGSEAEILEALGDDNVIVVSPIGGQGFVLGRGNQQLSPDVVRRSELLIVASRSKVAALGVLRVDTGDADLDEELAGWVRVRVGPLEQRLMEIV